MTTQEALAAAMAHHRAGQLAAAESLYRQVLAAEPGNASVCQQLGLLAFQSGRPDEAKDHLARAADLDRANPFYPHNLGLVCGAIGRHDDAVAAFRDALRLNPNYAEAHYELGNALRRLGNIDDAIAAYRRAIELRGDDFRAWNNLGVCLKDLSRWDEAIACYRKTSELRPGDDQPANNMGVCLFAQGKYPEAVAAYQRALSLAPGDPEILTNLGNVFLKLKQSERAVDCYRHAIASSPDHADAHNNMGNALKDLGRADEALAAYQEALRCNPNLAMAHNNCGNIYKDKGRHYDAIACYQKTLELNPTQAEAHNNLGVVWDDLDQREKAADCFRRALELEPDHADTHMHLGLMLLGIGDFANGWREYEWRWRSSQFPPREFLQPKWAGESLAGKTILLHAEQGLGDTVQFIRYAPRVKAAGGRVVVECQKALLPILKGFPGVDLFVTKGDALPPFDVHAALLSLPGIFRTDADSVPAEVPYLTADAALVEKWRQRLRGEGEITVGINWQGSKDYLGDYKRSIPLKFFARLAKIPGVRLVSLQKGYGTEQLDEFRKEFDVMVFGDDEVDRVHGAFMDTAAIMKNLDLVITSDTAILHVAGALGVPTWAALSFVADWRWLRGRNDCLWYPTMRLFRQRTVGDWAGVFDEIGNALAERVNQAAPSPPGTPGGEGRGEGGQRPSQNIDPSSAIDEVFSRDSDPLTPNPSPPEYRGRGASTLDADLAYEHANTLRRAGRLEEAIDYYRRAIAANPDDFRAHNNLGVTLRDLGRLDEAIPCYQRTSELRPQDDEPFNNLGVCLNELGRFDEAIAAYQNALKRSPNDPQIEVNIGNVYHQMARYDDAIACYRRVLEHHPHDANAHMHLGLMLLSTGQFAEGWPEYEWRWFTGQANRRNFRQPQWTGESLAGKTILLHAEQGLGDTIQFIRYAPLVKKFGGRVVVECQKALLPLLSGIPGVDQWVAFGEPLPAFDVHSSLLGVARILKTELSNIPTSQSYLDAEPSRIASWHERLKKTPGFKIGIAWQGAREFLLDHRRSIPLKHFAPLAKIPSVQLISLQKGFGAEQIAGVDFPVMELGDVDKAGAFLDTAAIMKNVDLVITSDTAILHLAGALGVPVYGALGFVADWRWLRDRDDCPWYPTMRLFRQPAVGDWTSVFEQIRQSLVVSGQSHRILND